MPEMVLGVGQQKSIRGVVDSADLEFKRIEGTPGTIEGRSANFEFTANRSKLDGEFDSFEIKVRPSKKVKEALLEIVSTLNGVCEHTEQDKFQVFRCPPEGTSDAEGAQKAIDLLCSKVRVPEVWRLDSGNYRADTISMELLFKAMIQYNASDIHLTPGQTPIFRVDNQARPSDLLGELSGQQIRDLIYQIAPERDLKTFEKERQCSFNYHQEGIGYARSSAFIKSGAPHLTFRYLPETIPSFDDLNVDTNLMTDLAKLHNGLLLVTGMTGSGKSTTCASLVDWINSNRTVHILTLEDPIEYVHQNKKGFISQRALGIDVDDFGKGVEGALRHDPDVILVGEMRDADTIRAAIAAASTGHLVISTLHSNNASGVINRIVSFFEPVERDLVRQQLVDSLRCVICQKLVPKKGGGRVPALEILFNDIKPISTSIVEGNTLGIRIGMQQNLSHSQLFEHYIYDLMKKDIIDMETAKEAAPEISLFEQIIMGTYTVPRIL